MNDEIAELIKKKSELRESLRYLWRVKETHLKELDEMLSRKWTEKTHDNVIYHAKQISLSFEEMEATQNKIDHLASRIKKASN